MNMESLVGEWHIQEMGMWDADYFNMEVQAFLKIDANCNGEFQFGLVSGQMQGKWKGNKYEFLWEGQDECDEDHGGGWLKLVDQNTLEGEFKFYNGDDSTFTATRNK